ncbi:class I SAM-dependent methyltransferase [Desulfovibrio inopinatus]|uniref:class I SAM-dependent methyltransferase n=1 Tax=Desulfovibrio inopinatus TaxID=102109 RepID=UPI0004039E01|nr:methyltransferase domain-containing protein [Desulfovibrio inopinatus]
MLEINTEKLDCKKDDVSRLKRLLTELGSERVWRPVFIEGKQVCRGQGFDEDGPQHALKHIDFNNKTVIDFGCNVGHYAFWAAGKGAQACFGVDVDADVIEAARLMAYVLGMQHVDFDVINFLENPLPTQYDVGLLVDFIGKATIAKGRLPAVVRAVDQAVTKEAIVTVRPRYHLQDDLARSEEEIADLQLAPFVHDGWFDLVACLKAWMPGWHFDMATQSDRLNRKFKYSLYLTRI